MQPISRDHGIALVCAHYGRKAVRASDVERLVFTEQMNTYCKKEMEAGRNCPTQLLHQSIAYHEDKK